MNNKINPKALEVARELRGYAAKEVCEGLGLLKSQYSKIENGGSGVNDHLLNKFCTFFNLPKEFFYRDIDLYHPNLHYRKKAAVTARILGMAEASMNVYRADIEIMLKAGALENVNLPVKRYADLTPQEAAHQLRIDWQIPKGPIKDLTKVIEDNGVIVVPIDFYTEEIDGRSMTTSRGQNIIFINKNLPGDRYRFTLAHELAHLLLHIYRLVDTEVDTEDEANKFASCFLVPPAELKAQVIGQKINFDTLLALKRYWKVSIAALASACQSAAIITKEQFKSLQTMISAKRIRYIEPEPFERETPTLLTQIVTEYIKEISKSMEGLAHQFSLNMDDFETRYFPQSEKRLKIVR